MLSNDLALLELIEGDAALTAAEVAAIRCCVRETGALIFDQAAEGKRVLLLDEDGAALHYVLMDSVDIYAGDASELLDDHCPWTDNAGVALYSEVRLAASSWQMHRSWMRTISGTT